MTLHKNARTMPASRCLIAERVLNEGGPLTAAAAAVVVAAGTQRSARSASNDARLERLEPTSG